MVGQIASQSDCPIPDSGGGGVATDLELLSAAMETDVERRTSSNIVALCTLDGRLFSGLRLS